VAALGLSSGVLLIGSPSASADVESPTSGIGWYRVADASWHLQDALVSESDASDHAFVYGPVGDPSSIPVAGDWDGDGKASVGWYRPGDGSWHLTNSLTDPAVTDYGFVYGPAGDSSVIPVVGDWDGDGKDGVGWYRPGDASWHLINGLAAPASGSSIAFVYGEVGNRSVTPVAGDWDGDGKDGVGWYRPGDASWHLINGLAAPASGSSIAFVYGEVGNTSVTPVAGDWDGDGKDGVGWYRPGDASWHLINGLAAPASGSDLAFVMGAPGAGIVPVVGDWDGYQPPVVAPPSVPAPQQADTAIAYARAQIGKPYQWGASGPNAFDCSGLTQKSWAAAGVSIQRTSKMQYATLTRVPYAQARPGDILAWGTSSSASSVYHVAIYLGGGRMIEAPSPGNPVRDTSVRTANLMPYVLRPAG
jgi:hypothetical protein